MADSAWVKRDETARLAALHGLDILDTPPEPELDRLMRLLTLATGVQSAAISLIDSDRQWLKARHAVSFVEIPRDIAFCDHTLDRRETFVVLDAADDPTFADNPLVTGEAAIRFYAGAPLFTRDGHCLGALCIIDTAPRAAFDPADRAVLEDCARLVEGILHSYGQRRMGQIAAQVVEATSDAVVAADRDGIIVYWNPAATRMFGYTREQALGRNVAFVIPEHMRLDPAHAGEGGDEEARESAGESAGEGAGEGTDEPGAGRRDEASDGTAADPAQNRRVGDFVELQVRHADGDLFPVEISMAVWGDAQTGGYAAIVRDLTARRLLEKDRRQARAFLDTIVANLPSMLFVKDAETGRYLLVNRKTEELVGRTAREMIGRTDRELFAETGFAYQARDREAVEKAEPTVFESRFVREDGQAVDLRTTRVVVDGPTRPGQYILGMSEDTTLMRRAQTENLRLARYDSLTGLLNRASFARRLNTLVEDRRPFALVTIDLDRFKSINDQFGHLAGDAVLRMVGDLLRREENGGIDICRIGGDEFVALLVGDDLHVRATALADRIVADIARPMHTGRVVAHLGASVGIAFYPEDGRSAERLREHADLALYRAKRRGGAVAYRFDPRLDVATGNRLKLESDLRAALETGAIGLRYQPLVSTRTGLPTSVEALARWDHPTRGAVPPDEFIAVAEDCGLIETLGTQLLNRACRDAARWRPDLRVAVNLSPIQFRSGELMATVRGALERSGLPANRLQLEVTERLMIRNTDRAFAQLEELRAQGIQILMDDFGVGHSALSYFQRFAFDKVKIDKSFIAEIEHSGAARAIVQAVVGLGRELSIAIVAEGIETHSQKTLLSALGCTHLQGYLFSRPVEAAQVPHLDTICAAIALRHDEAA